MAGVKKLLLFALAVVQVKSRRTDYCYAHDDHPYLYLGTRTSYHVYRGGNTSYQMIPNCEPVQIWMVIRHGTRYTEASKSEKFVVLSEIRNQIIKNHETQDHGHLCNADLENLKNWRLDPELTPETYGELSKQGIVDMKQLGERIKSHFPELFPPMIKNVSSVNYKFRAARRGRTRSSMDAMMSGIFDTLPFPDEDVPEVNLFEMNQDCLRWDEDMFKNELKEISRTVKNSTVVQELIWNVSSRLGYQVNISFGDIRNMWDMCRHDKAWNVNDLSPWCAVFSEDDLKVLEYREDLYDHHYRGPGHEINACRGCRMLRDMLQHFEKLEDIDHSKEPKAVFNIGRSASLHYFMAAMGLAKEKPSLTRKVDQVIGRQWRTSLIGTFAANIAAVFYKCNDTKSPNKVMFYLAEQPLRFEGCDQVGLCDWDYVKDKYREAVSNCSPDVGQLMPFSPSTSDVFILTLFFFLMLLTVGLSCRRFLRVLFPSHPSIPLYRKFCLRLHHKISPVHPLVHQLWRGRYERMPALQVV